MNKCPKCGSENTTTSFQIVTTRILFCRDCRTYWTPWQQEEIERYRNAPSQAIIECAALKQRLAEAQKEINSYRERYYDPKDWLSLIKTYGELHALAHQKITNFQQRLAAAEEALREVLEEKNWRDSDWAKMTDPDMPGYRAWVANRYFQKWSGK